MPPKISIILVTYNGGQYVSCQLESILAQGYTDWQLIIYDDGSSDNTIAVVNEYARQYPQKIKLIVNDSLGVKVSQFFLKLLRNADTDYVMFCDQDDVWLSNKISKTLQMMTAQEQRHGNRVPLLIFTDMIVVDKNLEVLSGSNLKYQNLNPRRISLNRLLFQNVPSGCTMMMNRTLADMCNPIPPEVVMHDHWVSLVAAAFGNIIFLDEPTMLYRQHDNNFYGASNYGWDYFFHRYKQGIDSIKARLDAYVDQAAAFSNRYADSLQPQHRQMLEDLARWPELSWLGRRKVLMKHRILKTGFRRNLGMFLIA